MADLDLVLVRTDSGMETYTTRVVANKSKDLTILDEQPPQVFGRTPAPTRKDGRPILPTTSVDEEAQKKAATSATDKK